MQPKVNSTTWCDLAIAVAEFGQAIALGSLPLVEAALASGALVPPYMQAG
ncbi:hypothetical protein [Labrys neptuniae]